MPPLYNAYEVKLLNVLYSKLRKENLSSYHPNLLNIHSSKDLTIFLFLFPFLFFLFFLFFLSFFISLSFFPPFFSINLRSHMATSFNQNLCVA